MLMESGEVECLLFMRLLVLSRCPWAHYAGGPCQCSTLHHSWYQPGGLALCARPSHAVVCLATLWRHRPSLGSVCEWLGFDQNGVLMENNVLLNFILQIRNKLHSGQTRDKIILWLADPS